MKNPHDLFAPGAFDRCLDKLRSNTEDYERAKALSLISTDDPNQEVRELATEKLNELLEKYLEEPVESPTHRWVRGVKVPIKRD